jgi:glycosyltransferase involved in cell wall biosynthesis
MDTEHRKIAGRPIPVRILFHINDFGKGGTETALIAWLNALDRERFEISVCVSFPTSDLDFWRIQCFPPEVTVHVLASKPWMHALHELRRQHKLSAGLKVIKNVLTYGLLRPIFNRKLKHLAQNYDVICDFDLSLRHVAGKFNVAWLGVSHFSLNARFSGSSPKQLKRRQAHLCRYHAVAVLTADMLREGRSLFPRLSTRLVELPNVIDVDAVRQKSLEPVDLPSTSYMISVARLDEAQKDHATLLRAFAQLRQMGQTSSDLCLVGEGPDRHRLEALASQLGIVSSVHFLGFRENPYPFILRARMLVLSSRYEGFGMVLGEAMALGVPVISTDCPTGPRDLLDAGAAGLLVPIGDAPALVDAMDKLSNDLQLRRALTESASLKIASFRPRRGADRMLDVITRIRPEIAARTPRLGLETLETAPRTIADEAEAMP